VDPTEDLTFPVKKIGEMAKAVCRGRTAWKNFRFPYSVQSQSLAKWGDFTAVMEELEGRPEYCLDLSFMYALLRLGYEFSEDREIRIGKQVRFFLIYIPYFLT
jgi:guanosine-diphosphatase